MAQTIRIPIEVVEKLQEALAGLENSLTPYRAEFLARMYRARASDIEGKGKTIREINKKFLLS